MHLVRHKCNHVAPESCSTSVSFRQKRSYSKDSGFVFRRPLTFIAFVTFGNPSKHSPSFFKYYFSDKYNHKIVCLVIKQEFNFVSYLLGHLFVAFVMIFCHAFVRLLCFSQHLLTTILDCAFAALWSSKTYLTLCRHKTKDRASQ